MSGETFIEDEIFIESENHDKTEQTISRRQLRELIFHILYIAEAWNYELTTKEIIDNLNKGFELNIPPEGEILTTASSIIAARNELDETIKPLLAHWRIERLGVCTRLILRLATWEYLNTDTAYQIIMNEAIELAKCFAEKDSYKFVNGILDELIERNKKKSEEVSS